MYAAKITANRRQSQGVNCILQTKISSSSLDANAVLNRLADALGISDEWGRDAELARQLGGISPKTVGAWRKRNSFDHDLVAAKCRELGISLNWAYFGDGPQKAIDAVAYADMMQGLEAIQRGLSGMPQPQKQSDESES